MTQEKHIAEALLDELAGYVGFFIYKERQKEGQKTGYQHKSEWHNDLLLNYDSQVALERCYEFVNENKHALALVQIIENIGCFTASLNTFSLASFRQQDPVQLKINDVLRRIVAEYDRWENDEWMPIVENYKGTHIFKDEEFMEKDNFNPALFCYVEEAIKKNLFKSYIYRQGTGRITQNTLYYIFPQIGISHSLEEWLGFIDKQDMSAAGDKAVVTLFYKQDYASEHYNYFIITIHHKDSIWLSTDQLFFYNPINKTSSRKPERRKEKHYENIALPYDICEEIPVLREKNKSLVRLNNEAIKRIEINLAEWKTMLDDLEKQRAREDAESGVHRFSMNNDYRYEAVVEQILKDENVVYSSTNHTHHGTEYKHEGSIKALWQEDRSNKNTLLIYNYPEILQKNFADLHTMQKMYFLGLVTRIFEEIGYTPPKEIVTTGQRHLTQLLLTTPDKSFAYDDNIAIETTEKMGYDKLREKNKYRFEGFSTFIHQQFDEMLEAFELEGNESKDVMISEYKQVVKSPSYERDWLGVPAALESNIKWAILNDKRVALVKKIKKLVTPERKKKDSELLAGMITNSLDTAYKLAFDDVKFSDNTYCGFSDKPVDKKDKTDRGLDYEHDLKMSEHMMSWISVTEKTIQKAGDAKGQSFWGSEFNILLPKGNHLSYNDRKNFIPKCKLCTDGIKLKHSRFRFHIKHYRQLMMMLGITDRMQLPLSYRNYRSSAYIPYKGNHILSNSHPYSLISDPMSKDHPNGFTISIWMCGNCFLKLKDKYKK